MKPWPEKNSLYYKGCEVVFNEAEYERARADAAIERLRLAVDALGRINASANGTSAIPTHKNYNPWSISNYCIETAGEALEAIGEVPGT